MVTRKTHLSGGDNVFSPDRSRLAAGELGVFSKLGRWMAENQKTHYCKSLEYKNSSNTQQVMSSRQQYATNKNYIFVSAKQMVY